MVEGEATSYPGGSKTRVTKAGAAVREGHATSDDLACIDLWRAAHAPVSNTFQALLRQRARSKQVVVGQRHKRKLTIFGKLERFPRMELARMDDIAGCRLIFDSIEKLHEFRKNLHGAKFKHKRNENDKYDYLKAPKKRATARISRMGTDFLVQEGRIWHEYQCVVVNEDARGWNTQRVNRMMGLCGSISIGG